jgi:hypothetical protein
MAKRRRFISLLFSTIGEMKESIKIIQQAIEKIPMGKRGELSVPGSLVAGFPGTTRILIMGFQLSTFCFEILRRVALWRAQYDESCKLCWGEELLPIVGLYGRICRGGLRGDGLPCGRCQRFKSAYL